MSSFYLPSEGLTERLRKGSLDGLVRISGHGQHGNQGNKVGTEHKRLSPEVKANVAVLARLVGNKAAEKVTGISQVTVGKYANGKDSNGEINPEHKKRVEDRLEGLGEKATQVIDNVLERLLDPARLADAKARDLGSIAANISSVVERLKGRNNVVVAGQVILMAPKEQKLENYQTIDVEARILD